MESARQAVAAWRDGAAVALVDVSPQLEVVASDITAAGGRAVAAHCDVGSE